MLLFMERKALCNQMLHLCQLWIGFIALLLKPVYKLLVELFALFNLQCQPVDAQARSAGRAACIPTSSTCRPCKQQQGINEQRAGSRCQTALGSQFGDTEDGQLQGT